MRNEEEPNLTLFFRPDSLAPADDNARTEKSLRCRKRRQRLIANRKGKGIHFAGDTRH